MVSESCSKTHLELSFPFLMWTYSSRVNTLSGLTWWVWGAACVWNLAPSVKFSSEPAESMLCGPTSLIFAAASHLKPQTGFEGLGWSGTPCVSVLAVVYLWVLLVFEVFIDGGVEVLGVALIQTVDLPLWLDLDIPLSQDELANGLLRKQLNI